MPNDGIEANSARISTAGAQSGPIAPYGPDGTRSSPPLRTVPCHGDAPLLPPPAGPRDEAIDGFIAEDTWSMLIERARRLLMRGGRSIVGITGPPGAGKSTLAAAIVDAFGGDAALVPMDGFHLANRELERLGRRQRKGAPDTFDAAGYVALLRRLRDGHDECVYAPAFQRELEEPIAGAIPIPRSAAMIITEGNYLLIEDSPWDTVPDLLDEVWYLSLDEDTRLDRLVERHRAYGKSPDSARAWTLGSDERNANLIRPTRQRADLVVDLIPATISPPRS